MAIQKVPLLCPAERLFLSYRAIARHPSLALGTASSLRSGRRLGVSSRGAQAPRDPSHRSGRQKSSLGATEKSSLGATEPIHVLPRRVSAEGPLASLGATKKVASGRQKKYPRGDNRGLRKFLKQPQRELRKFRVNCF